MVIGSPRVKRDREERDRLVRQANARRMHDQRKGGGFRAILNWTDAPIISSDSFEIGFPRVHAKVVVSQPAAKNSEIASNFSDTSPNQPPLLAFPAPGDELEQLGDVRTSDLQQNARPLREEGEGRKYTRRGLVRGPSAQVQGRKSLPRAAIRLSVPASVVITPGDRRRVWLRASVAMPRSRRAATTCGAGW